MSVELPIPNPENNTADNKRQFDSLYDEYAERLYCIILNLTDGDENAAVSLFAHVFAEVYKVQFYHCQDSQHSFLKLLQVFVQHIYRRGYAVQAIKKAILT